MDGHPKSSDWDNDDNEEDISYTASSSRHQRVKSNLVHSRSRWSNSHSLIALVCTLILMSAYYTNTRESPKLDSKLQPISARPARTSTLMRGDGALNDKAIILASYDGQDTSWIDDVPVDWSIYRYNLGGREARAYLNYIVNNYYNLPDYTIFHHGHNTSWHQIEPIAWKVRALNLNALDREGYINLRCQHDSGCTEDSLIGGAHVPVRLSQLHKTVGDMTIPFWSKLLKPYGFGELPDNIGHQCCAQFAVTRSAIQARSYDFYKDYQRPLEMTIEEGQTAFGPHWDYHHAVALYGYMWHIVFGKDALYCPAEEQCRKDFFSDAIACDEYPGSEQTSMGWKTIGCTNVWDNSV